MHAANTMSEQLKIVFFFLVADKLKKNQFAVHGLSIYEQPYKEGMWSSMSHQQTARTFSLNAVLLFPYLRNHRFGRIPEVCNQALNSTKWSDC